MERQPGSGGARGRLGREEPATPVGGVFIRFARVKKRFGPKIIYTGLDLEIRRGETTTVLGASGSGKSVMLKMLIGLLRADDGIITYDGHEIQSLGENEMYDVRRRIAYLFQGAALFDSLSVGENVAYGLREQFWNTMTDASECATRSRISASAWRIRWRRSVCRASRRCAPAICPAE